MLFLWKLVQKSETRENHQIYSKPIPLVDAL